MRKRLRGSRSKEEVGLEGMYGEFHEELYAPYLPTRPGVGGRDGEQFLGVGGRYEESVGVGGRDGESVGEGGRAGQSLGVQRR